MRIWLPVIRTGTGTDIFSIRLCNALMRRGIQCSITWFARYSELFPYIFLYHAPPRGTSIIHANSWNGFAFHREAIPLVVTEHLNVHDIKYSRYKSRLQSIYHNTFIKHYETQTFWRADKVTCVSQYTKRTLTQSFTLEDVEVIPTWVDTEVFKPVSDKPAPGKKRKLLFCGSLTRRKGWDLVPAIMSHLGADYELYYTGYPPGTEQDRLPGNMFPLGKIESSEMPKIYRQYDALLFPSRLEGLSQAVLEAMASGLPVVAANASSMPEVIRSGVNGILCNTEDVESYVSAIRQIFSNADLYKDISMNARLSVEDNYSENRVIPKYIEMYQSLID